MPTIDELTQYQYDILTLDLNIVRNNEELNLYGERVFFLSGTQTIYVRLNQITNQQIPFKPKDEFSIPFNKLYFSNSAYNETITLLIASKKDMNYVSNLVSVDTINSIVNPITVASITNPITVASITNPINVNEIIKVATTNNQTYVLCILANTTYNITLPINTKKFTMFNNLGNPWLFRQFNLGLYCKMQAWSSYSEDNILLPGNLIFEVQSTIGNDYIVCNYWT